MQLLLDPPMKPKQAQKSRKSSQGFYWQSDADLIQGFVEVLPIKIHKVNEFYYQKQSENTQRLIEQLFLQRNIPRLIKKSGKQHLIVDHIYDARDEASLQVWSRLCEYPPTHCVAVGYFSDSPLERLRQRRVDSIKLVLSLQCVGKRQSWAVQLIGRVVARLLSESHDNYLLTPNESNAEFWLQCVFAVVCGIREE